MREDGGRGLLDPHLSSLFLSGECTQLWQVQGLDTATHSSRDPEQDLRIESSLVPVTGAHRGRQEVWKSAAHSSASSRKVRILLSQGDGPGPPSFQVEEAHLSGGCSL